MLPDIIAQNRIKPIRDRRVLVRLGHNLQLAALEHQKAPARAKLLGRRLIELLLELRKAAKVGRDLRRQSRRWGRRRRRAS